MILSGIWNFVVKILITGFMVLHTTEKSLEELHLNFTMASTGKQRCVIWSMLLVLCYSRTRSPASFSCRETAWPLQTRFQAKGSQLKYPFPYLRQCPGSSSSLLHISVCCFILYKLQAKFEDNESLLTPFWTTTSLNKSKVNSTCHRKNTCYFWSTHQ